MEKIRRLIPDSFIDPKDFGVKLANKGAVFLLAYLVIVLRLIAVDDCIGRIKEIALL